MEYKSYERSSRRKSPAMLLQTLDLATQNSSPPQLLDSIFTLGEILHSRSEQKALTLSSAGSFLSFYWADPVSEESSFLSFSATETRSLEPRLRDMWPRYVPEKVVVDTKRSTSLASSMISVYSAEEFISLDVPTRSSFTERSRAEVEQPFVGTDETIDLTI